MKARIYHNPRCSKSRATLALLEDRGIGVDIVDYINDAPSVAELEALLAKLGVPAREIVRSNEAVFAESGLSVDSPAANLLAFISNNPKVLQRPIVETGTAARIGRPPEQVLELFE